MAYFKLHNKIWKLIKIASYMRWFFYDFDLFFFRLFILLYIIFKKKENFISIIIKKLFTLDKKNIIFFTLNMNNFRKKKLRWNAK